MCMPHAQRPGSVRPSRTVRLGALHKAEAGAAEIHSEGVQNQEAGAAFPRASAGAAKS